MINTPDHPRILALLAHPVVGLDLAVTDVWCHCRQPDTDLLGLGSDRSGCIMTLTSPDGLRELELRDLRWSDGPEAQLQAQGSRA